MNKQNEYRMEIEELLRKSSNGTIYEILEEINAKRDNICRILDNGRPIFELAPCQRFENLYQQRKKLWIKVTALDMCASILIKHLQ